MKKFIFKADDKGNTLAVATLEVNEDNQGKHRLSLVTDIVTKQSITDSQIVEELEDMLNNMEANEPANYIEVMRLYGAFTSQEIATDVYQNEENEAILTEFLFKEVYSDVIRQGEDGNVFYNWYSSGATYLPDEWGFRDVIKANPSIKALYDFWEDNRYNFYLEDKGELEKLENDLKEFEAPMYLGDILEDLLSE